MIKLAHVTDHLSITYFEPVELPDFTVMTGVNGSGKSHLLQAIHKRHVSIGGLDTPNTVLFNYEDFRMETEPEFNAQSIAAECDAAWQFFQTSILPQANHWKSNFGPEYSALTATATASGTPIALLPNPHSHAYKTALRQHFASPSLDNNTQAKSIYYLCLDLPYCICDITKSQFFALYKPTMLRQDFLPTYIGKLICDYYRKYCHNGAMGFLNIEHGGSHPHLTTPEFVAINGQPPWEVINALLAENKSLCYRLKPPTNQDPLLNYKLVLEHTDKPGLHIDFGQLSSGERVLMALVAAIYKASSNTHLPDVLLLDEIDASLHPSMALTLLNSIERSFSRNGVKVILVTHSPTTVALAPDDSLYVVNKSGNKRIEKQTKHDALSILTQGYATMDQGLRMLDQVSGSKLTIITEGNNTKIVKHVLALHGLTDVAVLDGIEHMSGTNQLRVLFFFFTRTSHRSRVLFLFDCDSSVRGLVENEDTYIYVMPRNPNNNIAKSGIENAFHPKVLTGFTKTITMANGHTITEFDDTAKCRFAQHVATLQKKESFASFRDFIEKIEQIRLNTALRNLP